MIPEISEILKDSFTKFFATVRPKIFDRKTGYRLLCTKNFDTPKFLKHWSDALEIFRHCEIKTFRRKNVITPLSSIKLFETKNFLKNSRVTFWKFWHYEIHKIWLKIVLCPRLYTSFFQCQAFFWKTEGLLYKDFRFGPVRQKSRQSPENISIPEFIRNAEVFPYEFHCHCQKMFVQRSLVISHSIA